MAFVIFDDWDWLVCWDIGDDRLWLVVGGGYWKIEYDQFRLDD